MRKIIMLVAIMVFGQSAMAMGSEQEFKIATDMNRPYEYTEGNKQIGLSSQIVYAVFERMHIEPKIEEYPRAIMEGKTYQGKTQAMYSVEDTPELRRRFKFAYTDLVSSGQMVVTLKKDNFPYKYPEDLKGHRVGVVRGFIFSFNHSFSLKDDTTPVYANSLEENFKNLQNGKVECIIMDDFAGHFFLADDPELYNQLTIHEYPVRWKRMYLVFNKHTSDDFIQEFSSNLLKFQLTPRYKNILNNYLNGNKD